MSASSALAMTGVLTLPYRRGAETLVLRLAADGQGWLRVPPYDFREYEARHGEGPPAPLYLLVARAATGRDPARVEVEVSLEAPRTVLADAVSEAAPALTVEDAAAFPAPPFTIRAGLELLRVTGTAGNRFSVVRGVEESTAAPHRPGSVVSLVEPEPPLALTLPPRTPAGASFALPVPPEAGPAARVLRLRPPGEGTARHAARWEIQVLLGNLARLAWVLGAEKDVLRARAREVRLQRVARHARGFSLDLLGTDLRVPRFPPREHPVDRDTVALYHLEEGVADGGDVADETARFRPPGHPGTAQGPPERTQGKFGGGYRFPGPGGAAGVEVATHADFDVAADGDLTVEAFARVDPDPAGAVRTVLSRGAQDGDGALAGAGWLLAVGTYRGIAGNLRWSVSDGATRVDVFADLGLADGAFHHLAGVLDRAAGRARLYVDGAERGAADASRLGAVAGVAPLRMGRGSAGAPFSGVLDEVRLSRAARPDFHPVLGEGDEAYRERLRIFQRWLLPTPGELARTLNGLVDLGAEPEPFDLVEADRAGVSAAQPLRVLPAALGVRGHVDRDGSPRSAEAEVCGTADDAEFTPALLARHDRPGVDYGGAEGNRRMQLAARDALDRLLELLAGEAVGGALRVGKAHDPEDTGLHRVGRALRLAHTVLDGSALGVYAHRAGFDWVRNDGESVHAAVAPGPLLRVVPAPADPAAEIDVFVRGTAELALEPAPLPAAALVRWSLIPCGAGGVRFEDPAAPAVPHSTRVAPPPVRVVGEAPGAVAVRAALTLNGRTWTATRTLRVGLVSLADGARVTADGSGGDEAAAAGEPEPDFDPAYLLAYDPLPRLGAEPRFQGGPEGRQVQLALEKRLDRLLELLRTSPSGITGLRVLRAFDPKDAGLHGVGRAVRLAHIAVAPGELAARAHAAGFDFVRREGDEVYAAVAPGPRIEVVTAAGAAPQVAIPVGTPLDVRARPALPAGGSWHWGIAGGEGQGSLSFLLRPATTFTPLAPGPLALTVTWLRADPARTAPYTFALRLKPALDVPGTVVPKHEYDLIMNVLNYFHPIGVEVDTANLRAHVAELRDDPLGAFAGYTYPDFRV